MRIAIRALFAGGLGFAAAVLVACGSSNGLLSGGQASHLSSQLDEVSSAVLAGQCGQAQNAVTGLQNAIANLGSINSTLVRNLNDGASTIARLANQDCVATQGHTSSTTASVTTPTTTNTTTTNTTTTNTTTTNTSTQTTPAQTQTTPATTTTPPGTTSTPGTGGAGLPGGGGQGDQGNGGVGTGSGQQQQ